MNERNVSLIERFYHDMWNQFDKSIFPELLTKDLHFRGSLGLFAEDSIGTMAPLALYRVLIDGTDDAGNVLRAIKKPGVVEIQF